MIKTIFLSLIITMIIGSCNTEKKSPIEGSWKLVYSKNASGLTFPADIQGGQIKTWSNGYYTFVGESVQDTLKHDKYGAGTYKLDGDRCEITRLYHYNPAMIGKNGRWLIEIRNDTLIQKSEPNENWELPETFSTEMYVRLK